MELEREAIRMMRQDYLPFGKPNFGDGEIDAVTRVLRSGWVGMGPETIAFEQELAAYLGVPYVVTVNSCTSALFLSLLVSGVEAGDEVICPSLTWCSTANAALYLGAKPVFCDIDPDTLCLAAKQVLARITPKTRAVMAVHFGGLAVDVEALRKALPRNVALISSSSATARVGVLRIARRATATVSVVRFTCIMVCPPLVGVRPLKLSASDGAARSQVLPPVGFAPPAGDHHPGRSGNGSGNRDRLLLERDGVNSHAQRRPYDNNRDAARHRKRW